MMAEAEYECQKREPLFYMKNRYVKGAFFFCPYFQTMQNTCVKCEIVWIGIFIISRTGFLTEIEEFCKRENYQCVDTSFSLG